MREEMCELQVMKQRPKGIAKQQIAVAFRKRSLGYLDGLVWDDIEQGGIEGHHTPRLLVDSTSNEGGVMIQQASVFCAQLHAELPKSSSPVVSKVTMNQQMCAMVGEKVKLGDFI